MSTSPSPSHAVKSLKLELGVKMTSMIADADVAQGPEEL
jgi:hypothetical protein